MAFSHKSIDRRNIKFFSAKKFLKTEFAIAKKFYWDNSFKRENEDLKIKFF